MTRILLVAQRDFLSTVSTKGFIIGLLIMPALVALVAVVGPRLMNNRTPGASGEIAIVDPTGRLGVELRAAIAPEAIRSRRLAEARRVAGAVTCAGVSCPDAAAGRSAPAARET